MKIGFIYICFVVLAIACENDIKVVNNLMTRKVGVEEGKYIESYMSTAGNVKAKLTAPYMIRSQLDSSKIEFTKSLNVIFYDSLLKPQSFLFAKYGRYYEFDNTVFLRDSIVLYNTNHDTLWCNELHWNQNTGRIYTYEPVVVAQDNPSLQQKVFARGGLTSDQEFKNFTLLNVGANHFNNSANSFIILKDSTALK